MYDEYHDNMTSYVGMRNGMHGCYIALFLYQISQLNGIFCHHISLSLLLFLGIFHSKIVSGILIDIKREVYFQSINFWWNALEFLAQNIPTTIKKAKRRIHDLKMATQNFVKLILQLFPGLILICLTFLQQTNFLPTFYNLSKPK